MSELNFWSEMTGWNFLGQFCHFWSSFLILWLTTFHMSKPNFISLNYYGACHFDIPHTFHNTVDFNKFSKKKKSYFWNCFSANGNRGSNILSSKNKLSASAWYYWFFCCWRAYFPNSKSSPTGWTWPITRTTDHWHLSLRYGSAFWLVMTVHGGINQSEM